ncbi:MAG: IS1 family transposase, partial [Rhodobacteraceae bacterium]|nr:IS1 family transposase [Paracoccaceae bacterium]
MANIVKVGGFCPNPDCPKHGQTEGNEIIRHGSTGQGKQRFRCKCCGQSFNENRGTLFYRKRTPEKDITEALAMLADGSGINSVSRVKGVKADTVVAWQREAGVLAEAVSDALLGDHEAGPSQVDGLWSFVVHKGSKKNLPETAFEGTFWRTTVLEMETRLRVAQGFGKSETAATEEAFGQLKGRGNPDAPPPLISDGWGGIDQALIEVYGHVPVYSGRGRPPTLKRPGEGWLYVMIIKHRDSTGNLVSVDRARARAQGGAGRRAPGPGHPGAKHRLRGAHPPDDARPRRASDAQGSAVLQGRVAA